MIRVAAFTLAAMATGFVFIPALGAIIWRVSL